MKLRFSVFFAFGALAALLFTCYAGFREARSLSWPLVEARVTKVEWKPIGKHGAPSVCCVPLLYLDVAGRQTLVSPFRRYIKETDRVAFRQNTEGKILRVQVNPNDADELIIEPGISMENFALTFSGGGIFLVFLFLSGLYWVLERKRVL